MTAPGWPLGARPWVDSAIVADQLAPGAWDLDTPEIITQYAGANALTPAAARRELGAPAAPRYWVLQASGYSDTQRDYTPAASRAAVAAELVDLGYLDNPAVTVFVGEREPWAESDPYPDWQVSRGVRGGVNWERA